MSNLTIRGKISCLVICLLGLMLFTIGVTALKLQSLGSEITAIAKEDIPLTATVTAITLKQLEQAIHFERALRFGENLQSSPAVEARFNNEVNVFDALTEKIETGIKAGEKITQGIMAQARSEAEVVEFKRIGKILRGVETKHRRYEQLVHKTFALLKEGKVNAGHAIVDKIVAEEQALDIELLVLLKVIEKFTENAAVQAEHDEQIAMQVSAIGSLSALIIGFGIAFFITRIITGAIQQAVDVANKIADDDLSSVIEATSNDEVGQLLVTLDSMQTNLKNRIEADHLSAAETGRIKQALDNVNSSVMVSDAHYNIIYMNAALQEMFRNAQFDIRKELPGFDAAKLLGAHVDLFDKHQAHSRMLDKLADSHTSELNIGGRILKITANPVIDTHGERIGTVVEWLDCTQEAAVEKEVQSIVSSALAGDLTQRITLENKQGFYEVLGNGINDLMDVSAQIINDTVRVMGAIARGDLSERIEDDYVGSFGQLKADANSTVSKLTEMIGEIKNSANLMLHGLQAISDGNASLSQRTEAQAASLVETASSMEKMTATVKLNADNARHANQLAEGAREQAENGGQVLNQAVAAMSEISASSSEISSIIGVIDEIAFQSNLLALNASVEAARAGEKGRGFAVVASEVRNLAQRSAAASKQIKDLIEDSATKVAEGTRLVDESGQTLSKIVSSVKKVSDIVAEISVASQEQSTGIEQVNKAVMQMDKSTQQNTAQVAEAASASEALGKQAQTMHKQVNFFQVGDDSLTVVAAPKERRDSAQRPWKQPKQTPAVTAEVRKVATPGNVQSDQWEEF